MGVFQMPLKNRNQHEPGKFRVQVACPNCGHRCLVRSSEAPSPITRQYYVWCTNHLCGWRGLGMFEITRTTHEPPPPLRYGTLPETVDASFFINPPAVEDQLF